MLRECDPSNTSSAEIAATVEIMNEVLAADLPEDPRWRNDLAKEYLTVTMPNERRVTILATAEDATLLGRASVLVTEEIGVLELMVRPAARRSGIGSALLRAIARRAAAEGVDTLGVEVVGGTPAIDFFAGNGFRPVCMEIRSVLTLADVDWSRLDEIASGTAAGYRVEFFPDGPPRELHRTYTEAKESIRNLAFPDPDLHPSSYGPDRLAASLDTLRARGLAPYVAVAVHERSERVAALTEVVVPAHRPTRADQYDTIVVPTHRGYGIDRAIKARMLIELRAAEPDLLDVQTWNSADNEQIIKINTELGFRTDREWREYAAPVAALVGEDPAVS